MCLCVIQCVAIQWLLSSHIMSREFSAGLVLLSSILRKDLATLTWICIIWWVFICIIIRHSCLPGSVIPQWHSIFPTLPSTICVMRFIMLLLIIHFGGKLKGVERWTIVKAITCCFEQEKLQGQKTEEEKGEWKKK